MHTPSEKFTNIDFLIRFWYDKEFFQNAILRPKIDQKVVLGTVP